MITVGMDEVGRGCWAGPLVAGAVVLSPKQRPSGIPVLLRDSKKLSKHQREESADWIYHHALSVGVGWVEPSEIDSIGLTRAVGLVMERALSQITMHYEELIIDGNYNFLPYEPRSRAVVRADDTYLAVSAASIVAKVARDDYMTTLDARYDGYGFDQHVGYGTAMHLEALRRLGVSDLHRRSYRPVKLLLAGDDGAELL
ncbi:ribonuclease HII [Candidatus Saccharibacteria bacterium]|nr:MAG: ribonuclease HII [Candidatus Saccharibacteria bacterium]